MCANRARNALCGDVKTLISITSTHNGLELASKLKISRPASKDEPDRLCTAIAHESDLRTCGEIEDEGDIYESIEDIWPDYPSEEDFFFDEDESYFDYNQQSVGLRSTCILNVEDVSVSDGSGVADLTAARQETRVCYLFVC